MANIGRVIVDSGPSSARKHRVFDPSKTLIVALANANGEKTLRFATVECEYLAYGEWTVRYATGSLDFFEIQPNTFKAGESANITLAGWIDRTTLPPTTPYDWYARSYNDKIRAAGRPPKFISASPGGEYINPLATSFFNITAEYDWLFFREALMGKTVFVEWKESGGLVHAISGYNGGAIMENRFEAVLLVSGNTFPVKSSVEYRIKLEFTDGAQTEWSPWKSFSTTDSTGYATPTSPINQFIDGSEETEFHWTWNISTGTVATKGDFQTSDDGGLNWDDLGSVSDFDGQIKPYIAAPGTLPAGSILWRVRGYNTDGVPGPWSGGVSIVVRQAPAAPIITGVTTVPRPTITWQASGQQAYQITGPQYDTGAAYGTDKTHQLAKALPDGPAELRVRVQNSFGLWSPWAAVTAAIANQPGKPISLRSKPVLGGIRLAWETEGLYPEYHIYRDGKVVGRAGGREHTDYTGIGKSVYTVQGVNPDTTYTVSNPISEVLRPKNALIAKVGEWVWLEMEGLRWKYPTVQISSQPEVTYTRYSGRTLPVAEFSGGRARSMTFGCTLRQREKVEALRAMLGGLAVYKDCNGTLLIGILDSLDETRDWYTDVTFTITEVDYGDAL